MATCGRSTTAGSTSPDDRRDRCAGLSFRVDGGQFLWRYSEQMLPTQARVPRDDVFGVLTADLDDKEALLAAESDIFFMVPHYDRSAMVCVRLEAVDRDHMRELIAGAIQKRIKMAAKSGTKKRRSSRRTQCPSGSSTADGPRGFRCAGYGWSLCPEKATTCLFISVQRSLRSGDFVYPELRTWG